MSDRTLSHRGYCGSIEVSLEDNCLFGKLLFIRDLVTYEGNTVDELEKAFRAAVDHYLAKCEKENLDAEKPFSGVFQVRIEPAEHREAAMKAASLGQSLNEFVRESIQLRMTAKTTVSVTNNHTHYHQISVAEFELEDTEVGAWRISNQKTSDKRH